MCMELLLWDGTLVHHSLSDKFQLMLTGPALCTSVFISVFYGIVYEGLYWSLDKLTMPS